MQQQRWLPSRKVGDRRRQGETKRRRRPAGESETECGRELGECWEVERGQRRGRTPTQPGNGSWVWGESEDSAFVPKLVDLPSAGLFRLSVWAGSRSHR